MHYRQPYKLAPWHKVIDVFISIEPETLILVSKDCNCLKNRILLKEKEQRILKSSPLTYAHSHILLFQIIQHYICYICYICIYCITDSLALKAVTQLQRTRLQRLK